MRNAFLASFFVLASLPAAAADTAGPLGQEGTWSLAFSDEFDGPRLDGSKWTTCYWWDDHGCTNLSSKEIEWYLPRNVTVADGALQLTARPEKVIGYKGREFPYTSGMVTSGRYSREKFRAPRFAIEPGSFIEVRAKIPSGQGLWPAIWLLPISHESRPEIDMLEALGHRPGVLEMHVHFKGTNGKRLDDGHKTNNPDLSKDWHVYGLDWQHNVLVWYLDGVEQWRFKDAANIPTEALYLLINLAVGGDWAGPPDEKTVFPATLAVDFVRVWREAK